MIYIWTLFTTQLFCSCINIFFSSIEDAHISALQMEIKLMKGLDHVNIVRYWGTEVKAEFLTIFMEYVPGGSLAAMLRRFGPFNAKLVSVYTTQLLRGLHYLHR